MTTANDFDDHENDELLSITEAAELLRVPVATMRYWRHCGTGPFSFKVARHVRYWRSDLIVWRAEQGRRPSQGGPEIPSQRPSTD